MPTTVMKIPSASTIQAAVPKPVMVAVTDTETLALFAAVTVA
jgi:hypothetical protein